MSYYFQYQHPTSTRGLVAGGFPVDSEQEGRHYLREYAALGFEATLWLGKTVVASTSHAA